MRLCHSDSLAESPAAKPGASPILMKLVTLLAVFLLATLPATAQQFVNGQAADVVLGQSDFTSTSTADQPNRFASPASVAMDPTTGKVFVGDSGHHRILRYSSMAAATSGSNPEAVFGQPNFNSYSENQGGAAGAKTLSYFYQIMVDHLGRLWVADSDNNRVLCWFAASTLGNNPPANLVFGQPDIFTVTYGTTASKMDYPVGIWVDSSDTLWVAEDGNSRVLRFDNISTKSNGDDADGVLGQVDFMSSGSGTTVTEMAAPYSVSVDASGRLWVADTGNHRVLRFDAAATKADGAAADGVLGQPDFDSNTAGLTAATMSGPYGVLALGGTVWVCDFGNDRVLGFPNAAALPNGAPATIVLGQPDLVSIDPTPSDRILHRPFNLSPGPAGSLFVASYGSNRIVRFTPLPSSTADAGAAAANAALKAHLLSKARKLKKKAKKAKKRAGKKAKAKKLTKKAKKLIKRANAL